MEDSAGKSNGASVAPKAVISRLSLYLRELQHLVRDGVTKTNSTQLGSRLGFSDAQVRKDLAYFGQFGHPGIGYRCEELISEIKHILGADRQWAVVLVGAGNLGRALLGYKGFGREGFNVVAAFDSDPAKAGSVIEGVEVLPFEQLAGIVAEHQVQLGVIAVPAPAAQGVAMAMVDAGISGVMNFAPCTLDLPPTVNQVGVDLAIELEQLSFAVANSQPDS